MSVAFASELQQFRQQLALIEQDLHAARKAHGMLRAFAEPLIVLAADATVLFVNGPGIAWLGHPGEPPAGRAARDVLPEAVAEPLLLQLDGGAARLITFEVYEPGRNQWLAVRAHRTAAEVVVELQDVTERKQLEAEQHTTLVRLRKERDAGAAALQQVWDELAAEQQRAAAAVGARGTFLSVLSAEVHRSVEGILAMTERLHHDELAGAERDEVEGIQAAAEALALVTESIADVAALETGLVQPMRTSFALHRTVEGVMDAVLGRGRAKHLELAYSIERGVPRQVVGDEARLRHIAESMMTHAIDRAERGAVTLTVDVDSSAVPPALTLAVRYLEDPAAPAPGLSSARSTETSSGEPAGSVPNPSPGLRLLIAERLAALLGGAMETHAEADAVTLVATLPLADAPAAQGRKGMGSAVASAPCPTPAAVHEAVEEKKDPLLDGRRVLIVDGHGTYCWLLRDQVEAWGMIPHAFIGAEEALSWLERAEPCDLVVIDDELPGVCGDALAARVKTLRPGLPVVLVGTGSRPEGDAAAFDVWLTKPYRQRALREVMRGLLTADEQEGVQREPGPVDDYEGERQAAVDPDSSSVDSEAADRAVAASPWGVLASDDPVLDFLDEILDACRHAIEALQRPLAEGLDAAATEAALRALQVNCQMLDVPALLEHCDRLWATYEADPSALKDPLQALSDELAVLVGRLEAQRTDPPSA